MRTPASPSVAARFDPAYRRLVARTRARFLDGAEGDDGVRAEIVHSWRRSRSSSVDPVGGTLPVLPLARGRANRLVEAAAPVLARFTEQARDTEAWVMLLDRDGVQVRPVAADEPIARESERRGCEPGAVYQESTVGTNGAGVSLERLESFVVVADEHFRESEHNLVSIGVPMRDGVGRIAGTLMLCHRVGTASPVLLPYAEGLAAQIGERLAARTDADDRRLFEEFLRYAHRPSLAVVALSDRVFVANRAAQRLLHGLPQLDRLRAAALDAAERGAREVTMEVEDVRLRLRCRPTPLSDGRVAVVASMTVVSSTTSSEPGPGRDRLGADRSDVDPQGRSVGLLEQAERKLIHEALRDAGWNREAAAAALGISRATLYRRLRRFGLQVPGSR